MSGLKIFGYLTSFSAALPHWGENLPKNQADLLFFPSQLTVHTGTPVTASH